MTINGSFQLTYATLFYPQMFLANTYIIFRVLCSLQRKGTSRRVMRAIRNRYIIYYLLTIPFYGTSYLILYADTQPENTLNYLKEWMRVLKITLLVSGFLKASIRLFEPFVYHNLIENIRSCQVCLCCCNN